MFSNAPHLRLHRGPTDRGPRQGKLTLGEAAAAAILVVLSACHLEAQDSPPIPFRVALDSVNEGDRLDLFARSDLAHVGGSVAPAGDVNGDGIPDLLVGASGEASENRGQVFLVYGEGGKPSPLQRELGPARRKMVQIDSGNESPDRFGTFVAGAGDINDDGFDDFLIGAPQGIGGLAQPGVVLIFGSDRLPIGLDLSVELAPHAIFITSSLAGEGSLGIAGSGLGDVDGDGIVDFALGIPDGLGPDRESEERPGKVIVILGNAELPLIVDTPVLDLESLPSDRGYSIHGPRDGSGFGMAIAGAGDIDGDDVGDYVAGAPFDGGGSVFVFFGQSGVISIPDPASPDGDTVVSVTAPGLLWDGARLGAALAGGLDATADDRPDLLLGLPMTTLANRFSGAAFLVPGGAHLRGNPNLELPNASTVILRDRGLSTSGASVAFVPDVDGDAKAELLIGAPNQFDSRGVAYLVYSGAVPTGEVFLPDLEPDQGVRFVANLPNSRVGHAVAGISDFDGDRRGEIVIGAPGFRRSERGGKGAAFVIFAGRNSTQGSPRDLKARLLPGRRVNLSWTVAGDHDSLNVFRDSNGPINPLPFPAQLMEFTDTSPPLGRVRYVVEANNDTNLRSNEVELFVGAIPVRGLRCARVDQGVLVQWSLADHYEALQVLLDGIVVTNLPFFATEVLLENVEPGEHLIEVRDSVIPQAGRSTCFLGIAGGQLPEIENFQCNVETPTRVRLSWTLAPIFDHYLVTRNGFPIAHIKNDNSFQDDGAPPGPLRYAIVGIADDRRRGPEASCEVAVSEPSPPFVHGRVRFDDAHGTPVGRGRVSLFDASGDVIGSAQVNSVGEFRIPVVEGTDVQLRYEVELGRDDFEDFDDRKTRVIPRGVLVRDSARFLASGSEVNVEIPLPILLLASEHESDAISPSLAVSRWAPLVDAAADLAIKGIDEPIPALFYAFAVPSGVGRGALAIARRAEFVRQDLQRQLGRAPAQVDLVAFGATGLATRLFVASSPHGAVHRAVLLGTPNLGTARGEIEARGELAAGPLPDLPDNEDSRPFDGEDSKAFSAAAEQTLTFLREFNRRVSDTHGVEAHLIAGTAGRTVLEPILGCSVHDDRVCVESALGAVPGAVTHLVAETHEDLGRAAESISLILDEILELSFSRATSPVVPFIENLQGAAGGDGDGSYALGTFYSGFIEPGSTAGLLLLSDTSESIIVILNSRQPGGINFNLETPSGETITPQTVGGGTEYHTYGDGEGNQLQLYTFTPAEVGTYTAQLLNPVDNVPIPYTVELYANTDKQLVIDLDPKSIEPDEATVLTATLRDSSGPLTDADVVAKVWRPNGQLNIFFLRDDAGAADTVAGDGVYASFVDAGDQAGLHLIEVTATGAGGAFSRERSTQLEVRSIAARFEGGFDSGTTEALGGAVYDSLWIEGDINVEVPGLFVVSGVLTDLGGQTVALAHTIVEVLAPQLVSFQLAFPGNMIFESELSGPYLVSSVELFDAAANYVLADSREDALQTTAYSWQEFGTAQHLPFIRGDSNADRRVDISDAINILLYLFSSGVDLRCLDAANINADASVEISDPIYLLNFLFQGTAPPPPPVEACDNAAASIGCEQFEACP